MELEYLDIVDSSGNPTGAVVERSVAHARGIAHRTSHVWIVRSSASGIQILLQKRCAAKESYPGCYDISSAGHIPAGTDHLSSALRELKEELGVDALAEELFFCGTRSVFVHSNFCGQEFHDNEFACVYLLWLDQEPSDFCLQPEEVEHVRWFDLEECLQAVCTGTIPNCIFLEELELAAACARQLYAEKS